VFFFFLFDDNTCRERIIVNELPQMRTQTNNLCQPSQDEEALRAALQTQLRGEQPSGISLRQVRDVRSRSVPWH